MNQFLFSGWIKKAGSCGDGKVTELLLSVRTIVAIAGLIAGSSWTHNNPMWMHLITSFLEYVSVRVGSSTSNGVPSLQCFQTWKKKIEWSKVAKSYAICFQERKTCTHIAHKVCSTPCLIEGTVLLSGYNLKD